MDSRTYPFGYCRLAKCDDRPGFLRLMDVVGRIDSYQARRGPRNTRAGNRMMAFNNSSTPSTANPSSRNGNRNNHTNGYSTSTSSAKGQQRNNKMHHRKKVNITPPLLNTLHLVAKFRAANHGRLRR